MEAVAGELRCGWGNPGSRAVATDLLTSAVRQIRALRRLGIAGAGKARARTPEPAGATRAGSVAAEAAPDSRTAVGGGGIQPEHPAREEEAKLKETKAEPAEEDSEYEEYTEEEGSEKEELPAAGLKPVPKASAERSDRSAIPRRRTVERSGDERSAGRGRAEPSREREVHRPSEHRREGHSERRDREHRREDRDERRRSRTRDRRRPANKPRRRRKRKGHRAGSRHQRLYRAEQEPFRRFHHQQPGEFWDRKPSDF